MIVREKKNLFHQMYNLRSDFYVENLIFYDDDDGKTKSVIQDGIKRQIKYIKQI